MGVLGQFSTVCANIAQKIPNSLHMLWNLQCNHVKAVQQYVVCKKCHKLYFLRDCIEGFDARRVSKKCSYQPFPNHPHYHMRKRCGTTLLKTVELVSGRKVFYPFLTYCYLGLECSLASFLRTADFVSACEQWRTRKVPQGIYKDVYDGKLWNDFLDYNNSPFLSEPFNYALMMNIDWFQPYKHVSYSVGVIYFVCMNLPRNVRFK